MFRKQIKTAYNMSKTSCCQSAGQYDSKHTHSAAVKEILKSDFSRQRRKYIFEIRVYAEPGHRRAISFCGLLKEFG